MACPPYQKQTIQPSWGENSDEAQRQRLAFALLADCLGSAFAANYYWRFTIKVVGKFDAAWEITSEEIEKFRDECALDAAANHCKDTKIKHASILA